MKQQNLHEQLANEYEESKFVLETKMQKVEVFQNMIIEMKHTLHTLKQTFKMK